MTIKLLKSISLILGTIGVLLFGVPGVRSFKHTQMAKRALQLVKNGQSENCVVEIRKESGDSRDFFKGIVSRSKSGKKWDILFTPPGWKVDPLVQKHLQAKAYFESETEYPLVVVTDEGHLWAERNPVRVNTSVKGPIKI